MAPTSENDVEMKSSDSQEDEVAREAGGASETKDADTLTLEGAEKKIILTFRL